LVYESPKHSQLFRLTELLEKEGFSRLSTKNSPYTEYGQVMGGVETIVHRENFSHDTDKPSSHVYRRLNSYVEIFFEWDPNMDNEWLVRLTCSDDGMKGKLDKILK